MKSNNLSDADPELNERSIPSYEQLERLTKREKQVLFWIVEGKTNGDIGKILGISHRTVEKHCESIFRKLGIENRYAAIVCALTNNWQLKEEE